MLAALAYLQEHLSFFAKRLTNKLDIFTDHRVPLKFFFLHTLIHPDIHF